MKAHQLAPLALALLVAGSPCLAQDEDGLPLPPTLSASEAGDLQAAAPAERWAGIRRGLASLDPRQRQRAARLLEAAVVELFGQARQVKQVSRELIQTLAEALSSDEDPVYAPASRSAKLLLAKCQDQAPTAEAAGACVEQLGLSSAMRSLGMAHERELVLAPVNRGPGLEAHMQKAIEINWDRMSRYAELAGQAAYAQAKPRRQGQRGPHPGIRKATKARRDAYWVSLYMLTSEWLTTFALSGLDEDAKALNEAGVPVLAEDVIPLRPRDIHTPPTYRGVADEARLDAAHATLARFREACQAALANADFGAVADASRRTITQLEALEQDGRCHFAMTRHLVASVGYCALRAMEHLRVATPAQRPAVVELVTRYLEQHTGSLVHGFGVRLDSWAQPLHALGVGMVVNEFPGGHFSRAYDAIRAFEDAPR